MVVGGEAEVERLAELVEKVVQVVLDPPWLFLHTKPTRPTYRDNRS